MSFQTFQEGIVAANDRIRAVAALFKPPPRLTVSQWAEQFRYLSPEASAEPGKWRNARNPVLVEPMDALSPFSLYHTVVLKFSSQIGKTEVLNNFCGYIVDQDPGPTLVLQPNSKPMAEAWSKDRLAPMIRDTPTLRQKVDDPRSRDSANTIAHKKFPGGHLTIAGANSPAGLASRPIRYMLADEIDRYPASAGSEGSALKLARKRQATFWNRKTLYISSPTFEDVGIDAEYKRSDMRKYWVPCPDCGERQVLRFEQVKWSKENPEDVHYCCEHCGVLIPPSKKPWMVANGKWIADRPEVKGIAGFWISQLYSPFVAWAETVAEFLDCENDPVKLQTFINTALAETWIERGDAPEWTQVKACALDYVTKSVPAGTILLTAAVDVQKDRLVYSIRGWGVKLTSWLVDFGELYGETDKGEVWEKLEKLLDSTYDGMGIQLMMVDSGYRTDQVYAFCHKHMHRAYPSKGHDVLEKPFRPADIEVQKGKKRIKLGMKLWHLNSGYMKSWVHTRVKWTPGAPGYWAVPSDVTEDYCKQVVAEGQSVTESGKVVWVRHNRENHFLDCEAMHAAMAHILALHTLQGVAEQQTSRRVRSPGVQI